MIHSTCSPTNPKQQRGFLIIAAAVLIVVIALFGAALAVMFGL